MLTNPGGNPPQRGDYPATAAGGANALMLSRRQSLAWSPPFRFALAFSAGGAPAGASAAFGAAPLAGSVGTAEASGLAAPGRSSLRRACDAHEEATVEALHEWRKQAKYLRYQLELLR